MRGPVTSSPACTRAFPDVPVIRVNTATAEMIKYASNTLLATLISFTNELANLGAAVGGVDTVEVMRGVHASRYLTVAAGDAARTAPITSFLQRRDRLRRQLPAEGHPGPHRPR